jgi:peptide-O-fucosyltransferase
VKKESCFFPIPQAAECILRIVEKANAPVIYLSTDAAESETNLLQSLVVFNDRQVPLVKRPEHHSSEKWDALLNRNRMGGDGQVHIWSCVVFFLMLSVTVLLNNDTLL